MNVCEYGKPFEVGDLEVIAYEVDHSLSGATAYLIHASGREVKETLEKINPKMIIPIHTAKPGNLKQYFDTIRLPKYGSTITL